MGGVSRVSGCASVVVGGSPPAVTLGTPTCGAAVTGSVHVVSLAVAAACVVAGTVVVLLPQFATADGTGTKCVEPGRVIISQLMKPGGVWRVSNGTDAGGSGFMGSGGGN